MSDWPESLLPDEQDQQPKSQQNQDSSTGQSQKRKASVASLDGTNGPSHGRSVKRRASKACQCCRARKVRCNVTEHGAPCTNCRLDEVECIVSESRRKKKWNKPENRTAEAKNLGSSRRIASRMNASGGPRPQERTSASARSHDHLHGRPRPDEEHVPHSIYQTHGRRHTYGNFQPVDRRFSMSGASASAFSGMGGSPVDLRQQLFLAPPTLPNYVKPLPQRIGSDEIAYLERKGALSIPPIPLRNELLKAYIEFVHPFMPLVDLYDFVMIIDSGNGTLGRISLILFQAVMFAGSAFCDMDYLRAAGYTNRKEARKDFFQKTRLLYDFDYEQDRVALVQAILLLTFYYETPDDQKDTWHWMGVATSLAHTIGLHRNAAKSWLDSKRLHLWKRIWWCLYMRDRLIALGMRRPTRVKAEDCDVPMLTMDDFDIVAIPESVSCVPFDTLIARNRAHQRQTATMCIEKAKLCVCISHVLSKQYCVLNNQLGMSNERTTMMLLPKKGEPETDELKACDDELQRWLDELPEEAKYEENLTGNPAIDLNRTLLHMIFMTTLSALHRPQVLPSEPPKAERSANGSTPELLEISRKNVRRAAFAITNMAQQLDAHDLVRYLPTTGVTVLLPAIIIHLLDIKSPDEETRRNSLRGFCQCMQVMAKLRETYAAADYSTAFLEAAIRKAGIQLTPPQGQFVNPAEVTSDGSQSPKADPKSQTVMSVEALVDAGRRMEMADSQSPPYIAPAVPAAMPRTLTPPPDKEVGNSDVEDMPVTDEEVARRLETFLASTPPESDHTSSSETNSAIVVNGNGYNTVKDFVDPSLDLFGEVKRESWSKNARSKTQKDWAIPGNTVTGLTLDLTNESIFPMWQNMQAEFDENEFDSLMNLDAMGETFSFEEGLEAAVKLQDHGLSAGLGGDPWQMGLGESAA